MRGRALTLILVVLLIIALAYGAGVLFSLLQGGRDMKKLAFDKPDQHIYLLDLSGEILSSDDFLDEVRDVTDNDEVAAVILRINSPGGAVGPSQEMLEAVKNLDKKKPVIASMGSVAASGGYYVALGARKIVANPGTITGSIGVRMDHVQVGELLTWAKVHHETITSGVFKDVPSLDRPMTPEERALLQGMLDDVHDQFKQAVVDGRKLSREVVDQLADGRVYSGRQAKQNGLIDELGGLPTAIELAKNIANIKGEPELLRREEESSFVWKHLLKGSLTNLFEFVETKIKSYPEMRFQARM